MTPEQKRQILDRLRVIRGNLALITSATSAGDHARAVKTAEDTAQLSSEVLHLVRDAAPQKGGRK